MTDCTNAAKVAYAMREYFDGPRDGPVNEKAKGTFRVHASTVARWIKQLEAEPIREGKPMTDCKHERCEWDAERRLWLAYADVTERDTPYPIAIRTTGCPDCCAKLPPIETPKECTCPAFYEMCSCGAVDYKAMYGAKLPEGGPLRTQITRAEKTQLELAAAYCDQERRKFYGEASPAASVIHRLLARCEVIE